MVVSTESEVQNIMQALLRLHVPETTMHVPLPWHRLAQIGTVALVAQLVNRLEYNITAYICSFLARMGRMMTLCFINIPLSSLFTMTSYEIHHIMCDHVLGIFIHA